MPGYTGKILRVDLTSNEIETENLDPAVVKDYIGGRGLGIYYLNRELDPRCDPLSAENMLILLTGPLTGTRAPTGSRYMVMTKSPLTGALTSSNAGGFFPTEMKRAGFDGMIITGRSDQPVYLWVGDGKIELRPATHLWGKPTDETTDLLFAETDPKARVACIGPAGENLVRFAAIMSDKGRAAGRSGVGAVMGSKNLKAIVVRGKGKMEIHDEAKFSRFNKSLLKDFKAEAEKTPVGLTLYGTTYGVGTMGAFGTLPTKNFQQSQFDKWDGGIQEEFHEKYFIKSKACFSCPIGCTRLTKIEEDGREWTGEGPEYETWYAMGSSCMIDDLEPIIKANFLCNELGMDTITMGATVACAMELFESGHLNEDQIGRSLNWGDGDALVALTRQTAYREGIGDLLAEGSYRLAEHCGRPEVAMVSKKQEFAGYMPRRMQGMGLAYATSPVGGSHMRGDPAYFEIFGTPVKVKAGAWEGKANLVKRCQELSCIIDSAGLCIFFAYRALVDKTLDTDPVPIMEYLNAATGADYNIDELLEAGERIFNAERQFLTKAGFSRKDDCLPSRQTQEELADGPGEGEICHLEEMLDEYYQLRGWTQDGIPSKETLDRLGLA